MVVFGFGISMGKCPNSTGIGKKTKVSAGKEVMGCLTIGRRDGKRRGMAP